jgi:hypothetical protein
MEVNDCVVNTFRLEFPTPDCIYMGHRDSYAASALCQDREKAQDFPASALFEDKGSHNSSDSETRLEEEEDNVIEEIESEVESEEFDEVVVSETEDELVVPETQESAHMVVFETQPESEVDTQPHTVAAGHTYGGFRPPTESDGDEYLSYSQISSHLLDQGYICYHCGNGISTAWCPTCTSGG